jgi:hypothetical protein
MKKTLNRYLLGVLLVGAASLVSAGCDDSSAVKEPSSDAGVSNPGNGVAEDGGSKDCFDNPKTHFEIVNACTNATRITKNPTLNKLLPDGGLPPLD